ncbi:hypothetical protein [Heyndrickxia coagulans]|uniref:hypothetical protein n=1 Tax=Heyndrickxia coagulans TaxID=1398 RepID=UPI000B046661|nr:hypothetical protein [Heyndrickxia coagulans]
MPRGPREKKAAQFYSQDTSRESLFGIGALTGSQEMHNAHDGGGGIQLCFSLCTCCSCCSGGGGGSAQMKKVV